MKKPKPTTRQWRVILHITEEVNNDSIRFMTRPQLMEWLSLRLSERDMKIEVRLVERNDL